MEKLDISCLPEKVLRHVFSYLADYQKLNVSSVCKRWLKAVDCPLLLQDISLFWSRNSRPEKPFVFTRQFSKFIFEEINLSSEHLEFFRQYGKNIRELTFADCSVSDSFKRLNNFPYLPELKILHLITNNLTAIQWRQIAPNLTELDLIIDQNYGSPKKIADFVNTFGNIELRMIYTFSYEEYNLFHLENLKLKTFTTRKLSSSCLDFIKMNDTISDLSLASLDLTNEEIIQACNALPLLEKLSLWKTVLNSCLVNIFQLEHLKSLVIFDPKVRKDDLIVALRAPRLGHLKELTLHLVSIEIGDELFRDLLIQIPQISYFELRDCNFVNNVKVQYISKHLVNLRSLILENCIQLTDEGLFVHDKADQSLPNIKGLRGLNIISCPRITSAGLLRAIEFLELRYLLIDVCHARMLTEGTIKVKNPSFRKVKYWYW